MSTTTATELSIAGALATLATLAPSADVTTAIGMVTTAPTDASGTARVWFENHRGQHVDTVQFRTWCGHDTLAVWAPLDREIDTPKASYATLNGSAMTYKGTTVLGASTTALVTIDRAGGFLTFYRLARHEPTVTRGGAMDDRGLPFVATDGISYAYGRTAEHALAELATVNAPTNDAAPEDAPTDPRPTLAIVSNGRPFNIRRVDIGQRYGLTDRLTNDRAPMVEVFDASPELARFGPLGQFVSRYYVDTFAAIVDGVNLDGAVEVWTLTADAVREVKAWLATFDADETPAPTDPENLNGVMEFDHVVRVLPGRIVVDGPEGVYAPTLLDHDIDSDQWSPVGNYTSQQGGGWLMHNCESIGGRMAEDILDEPGVYVAIVANWSPDADDDCDGEGDCDSDHVEGWAVVRLADEHDPDEADDEPLAERELPYEHTNGVIELFPDDPAATVCGACGRGWDDDHVSSVTPTPSGRCPFEYEHPDDDETETPDVDVDTLDELRSAATMLARIVAILADCENWSATTLDDIGNALIGADYARTDDEGMFTTTNRVGGVAR